MEMVNIMEKDKNVKQMENLSGMLIKLLLLIILNGVEKELMKIK